MYAIYGGISGKWTQPTEHKAANDFQMLQYEQYCKLESYIITDRPIS